MQVFEVEDFRSQRLREITPGTLTPQETRKLRAAYDPIEDLRSRLYEGMTTRTINGRRPTTLMESFIAQPDAANLLRTGLNFLSFLSYNEMPTTYQMIAKTLTSNKPQEEYLRDAIIGIIAPGRSGVPAPTLTGGFEGGTTIRNYPYPGIVEVLGDDVRFDRLGKIRQIAEELGRAMRMTEEYTVYNTITTAGNYVRTATAGDNDVGANTAATTFGPTGLGETAYTTIATMRDRKSGAYLGLMPDTLIVTPKLQFYAKNLLFSDELRRVGGNTTNEVYGSGTDNVFKGLITKLIISPWLGTSYQWALFDSRYTSLVFQQVEPFTILQEAQDASSEAWLTRDVTRYLVHGYFGTGFVDDRAWYFSSSSTAPTGV